MLCPRHIWGYVSVPFYINTLFWRAVTVTRIFLKFLGSSKEQANNLMRGTSSAVTSFSSQTLSAAIEHKSASVGHFLFQAHKTFACLLQNNNVPSSPVGFGYFPMDFGTHCHGQEHILIISVSSFRRHCMYNNYEQVVHILSTA